MAFEGFKRGCFPVLRGAVYFQTGIHYALADSLVNSAAAVTVTALSIYAVAESNLVYITVTIQPHNAALQFHNV